MFYGHADIFCGTLSVSNSIFMNAWWVEFSWRCVMPAYKLDTSCKVKLINSRLDIMEHMHDEPDHYLGR